MLFIIVEYYFLPGSLIAFIYSSLPNNPNLAVEGQIFVMGIHKVTFVIDLGQAQHSGTWKELPKGVVNPGIIGNYFIP